MKKKLLLSSILSIVMCFSLICGATFALFTSEDKVNIAVTSGTVSVVASIDQNSVQTKKLYDATYTQGANNMFEGVATFNEDGLTLNKLVPGDGIMFNIIVKNNSNVTIKYRTTILCENDTGLFAGLKVSVADRENYDGKKYVTNWASLEDGLPDAEIPVVIELPEGAGNDYQDKTCTISYKVEAVQGNAKTENLSTSIELDGNATGSGTLQTNGPDSPIVELPAEVLNDISTTVGTDSVALKHSEPMYDSDNNSIKFETMEIVDENDNEIDLEQMGNTEKIPVKLPAQTTFGTGETVHIFHDDVHIADATVAADGTISYETTHFCEVVVTQDKLFGSSFKVANYDEFKEVLSKVDAAKKDFTIVLGSDITLTEQLYLNKGIKLTLDLNGYDIDANISKDELIELQNTVGNALIIKSSQSNARIDVGAKSLILAYADVEISNVEIVVDKITSSNYRTIKMQKGDLTIKDSEFNVHYLGTSLINAASSVVIDNVKLWINTFKTNAGAIIDNNAATQVVIKNVGGNISLDMTYSQYLVMRDADNVTMENFNAAIQDKDNAYYEIVRIENEYVNDRIGFKKIVVADIYNKLASGEDVVLNANLTINADYSNGYGATGFNIFGGTFDMNGKTLKVRASGTWDTAINITAGTIKNVKIAQGFRGIFINHNSDTTGTVYLENVIVEGPTYTISCDQGNGVHPGLVATNCTFNGWTSYAATLGNAKFTNCNFGKGSGNNFSRPYAPTEYVGCNFAEGHEIDPRAAVTFENCTINGVPLTAENISTLVTSNIANVTVK